MIVSGTDVIPGQRQIWRESIGSREKPLSNKEAEGAFAYHSHGLRPSELS